MPNYLARLAHEGMTHETFMPPDNPIGNAISQWGRGVRERTMHPLETLANEADRYRNMPVGELAGNLIGTGVTAWHGSPHLFDKFKSEAIGTGEGAQAYGHGLYLAENPKVAQGYQKTLAKDGFLKSDGTVFNPDSLEHLNVKVPMYKNDLDGAIEKAKSIASGDSPSAALAARDLQKLQAIRDSGGLTTNTGHLYKTDIPDSHIDKMLDWDKPLSEQHPDVQAALRKAHGDAFDYSASKGTTGENFYKFFLDGENNWEGASTNLQKAGIPGIKYLDGSSRNTATFTITPPHQTVAGDWMVKSSDYNSKGMHFATEAEAKQALQDAQNNATRNFVMFNPEDIRILERNGVETGAKPWSADAPMTYDDLLSTAQKSVRDMMARNSTK